MKTYRKPVGTALGAGLVLVAVLSAPVGGWAVAQDAAAPEAAPAAAPVAPKTVAPKPAKVEAPKPAKPEASTPAKPEASTPAKPEASTPEGAAVAPVAPIQSQADPSADAEYNAELEAAAASLKADIKAESDASAAAVTDTQTGPSQNGIIAASVIAVLGIVAMIFIIPATLRARRRRRRAVSDMISGQGSGQHEVKRKRRSKPEE